MKKIANNRVALPFFELIFIQTSQVNNYYNNRGGGGVNTEAYDTHHRMALAARTQRVRGNTARYNEFQRGRGRARVAARPPGPPPYNYNY